MEWGERERERGREKEREVSWYILFTFSFPQCNDLVDKNFGTIWLLVKSEFVSSAHLLIAFTLTPSHTHTHTHTHRTMTSSVSR